jgi:hypothetical protein
VSAFHAILRYLEIHSHFVKLNDEVWNNVDMAAKSRKTRKNIISGRVISMCTNEYDPVKSLLHNFVPLHAVPSYKELSIYRAQNLAIRLFTKLSMNQNRNSDFLRIRRLWPFKTVLHGLNGLDAN